MCCWIKKQIEPFPIHPINVQMTAFHFVSSVLRQSNQPKKPPSLSSAGSPTVIDLVDSDEEDLEIDSEKSISTNRRKTGRAPMPSTSGSGSQERVMTVSERINLAKVKKVK